MNGEIKENKTESGWQDETSQRAESVANFVENNVGNKRFDGLTEFHFSGGVSDDIWKKVHGGDVGVLSEVRCYYENGIMEKIHIVFSAGDGKAGLDLYLSGKALEEYLSGESEK